MGFVVMDESRADAIIGKMGEFEGDMHEALCSLEHTISAFKSNEVVQSFVTSGKVGADTENKLEQIYNAFMQYYDSTISRLIAESRMALESIVDVNNSNYVN